MSAEGPPGSNDRSGPVVSRRWLLTAGLTGLAGAGLGVLDLKVLHIGQGHPSREYPKASPSVTTQPPASTSESAPPTTNGIPDTLPRNRKIKGFQSGMTFTSYTTGQLGSSEGIAQLQKIDGTGASAVSLVPTGYQEGSNATTIYKHPQKTSSDGEITDTIRRAHEMGMTVLLKPHVDSLDNTPRENIGTGFDRAGRRAWFDSYGNFIRSYAQIAAANDVEVFSVGTELKGLSPNADQWGRIVSMVRNEYGGKVTYAANYNEAFSWYPDLDYIGVDDYSPLTGPQTPQNLSAFWRQRFSQYGQLSQQFGKPFLLTELGCASSNGAWANPQDTGGAANERVQADWYQAVFNAIPYAQGAVDGIYLWNWYPYDIPNPAQDTGLTPQGKEGQTVFTSFNRAHILRRR